MNKYATLITKRSITVSWDGESHTVHRDNAKFDDLVLAIREQRWEDVEKLVTPEKAIEAKTQGDMMVKDGQVFVTCDGEPWPVPTRLNSTILDYVETDLPAQPLVKFAQNLKANPSFRSVNQLFDFIEHNHMTITEDGCFIAYKAVCEDFKDIHSRTFDNSPGQVVSMPRNEVNDNPEETCSRGLHVAAISYAKDHFARNDKRDKLIYVKVNPADVVSVPVDYNNQKMRTCKYEVLGVCEHEFKEKLYTEEVNSYDSDYEDNDDLDDDAEDDEEEVYCKECGSRFYDNSNNSLCSYCDDYDDQF